MFSPPATTLIGLVYFDVADVSNTQYDSTAKLTSADVDPNGPGIDITRFYIGFNHSFDTTWSAKFLSFYTTTASPGATPWYIKEAYLQGKFDDWASLRLGTAVEPWTSYVEPIYGYRFVEQTFTEREGIANTADIGAHLAGKGDVFNYDFAVVNGGGYKNPGRTKTVDEEGRIGLTPLPGLSFGLGFYRGELGQDTEAAQLANAGKRMNAATRLDFLAAWKADGLTIGGEYVHARNFSNSLIFSNTTDSQIGYSLFFSYDFAPAYSVFARYDEYRPNDESNSSIQEKYWNVGLAWRYSGNITWALVYKSDRFTDNLKHPTDDNELKSDQFGLWAQVKF